MPWATCASKTVSPFSPPTLNVHPPSVLAHARVPCRRCALHPDENKKEVMQLRGVDYILRLLKASDETVNRWACNAIGILCMENGTNPVTLLSMR